MSVTPRPHTTLTQVARAAGVGLATASYALRHDPKIPAATAARVAAVAERLGYRPNPRIAALMTHIRRGRSVPAGERIAFVWPDPLPGDRRPRSVWLDGARRRAEQLGYVLEEFFLGANDMTPRRLAGILRARNITGLVISPLRAHSSFHLDWDWSQFSTAIIGNAVSTPELNHAGHHHFGGMRLALGRLEEAGFRRVAALLDEDINERARRSWSAAFLEHHPNRTGARRFLATTTEANVAAAARRLWKRRPDALITTLPLLTRLRSVRAEPPAGTKIALLDWQPNSNGWAGIDQCEEVIAGNAIDLVVGQLHRNERGVPTHVQMLLFPGIWRNSGDATKTG
ncbi:MAG TPA: LacI family DNA-binding transcriptional regulator [Opitutaceae bacterium]|nr:LacI family DNA-binding transcriptional regulator [Opitutaceae bacterium]